MATWITCEVEGCRSIAKASADPYAGPPEGWALVQRGRAGDGPRRPAQLVCDEHPEIEDLLGPADDEIPKAPAWVQDAIKDALKDDEGKSS